MRISYLATPLQVALLLPLTCAAADLPTTRRALPALILGAAPTESFLVEGVERDAVPGGIGFHIATDRLKQVCAVYDVADGTPLFMSDGKQTLIYDLPNRRIVIAARSRAYFALKWEPPAPEKKSMRMTLGTALNSEEPNPSDEDIAGIRLQALLTAPNIEVLESRPDRELLVVERPNGAKETILRDPRDASWFRFASMSKGNDFYSIELTATLIGKSVPDSALAFPDIQRLRGDMPGVEIIELDVSGIIDTAKFLNSTRGWMAKFGIAHAQEGRKAAAATVPGVEWEEIQRRDRDLGKKYRAALAAQGVRFERTKAVTPE